MNDSSIVDSGFLDGVDVAIRRRLSEQQLPGASVAIVRGSEPVLVRGYGFADTANQIPVTADTAFQIASLTKQFVAVLVLMLARDGMLHLDDPISKWFPEGGPRWSMISVRHLMAHLSGISDSPMDALDDQRDYSDDEFVAIIASAPLLCPAGTKWEYCNSGYALLGFMIGRIVGKHWSEVMAERIFSPLGMTSARLVDEVSEPGRAIGYELSDDRFDVQRWIAPSHNTLADGGLLMSAQDFVRWAGAFGSDALLPFAELKEVWEPVRFRDGQVAGTAAHRFGLGWMLPTYDGLPRMAQHEGAWQGFSTYIGRMLDDEFTVVVLTNLDDEFSHPAVIGRDILHLWAQKLRK